jgi:tellurite resistance protein TehA-like permease
LERHAKEKLGERGTKLQLFAGTLFSNLPYMMLCCIPLFAFVLKILYLRRHIFYIDHLIYALHIHTFAYVASMLIIAATLGLNRIAPGALSSWGIAVLWIAFAAQIFLSIRRVYRQGWSISVFKFFLGGFVYLIVLCSAFAVTFFITLALPS